MKYSEGSPSEYFIPQGNFLWNTPRFRSITDNYNFTTQRVAGSPQQFKKQLLWALLQILYIHTELH